MGETKLVSPLKWEKWQIQAKLALLVKVNITLDIQFCPQPEQVQLPLDSIYEDTVQGSAVQSERERLASSAAMKINWENRCQ